MKKLLIKIVIVLILLVAVLYLARNFIVRKSVETGTKAVTGFPLTIGAMDLGLLNGRIQIDNLILANPADFPEKNFVDLPKFVVDYHTLSMVGGAPHIKELLVDVTEVVVVKNQKGESNVDRLQAAFAGESTGTETGKPTGGDKKRQYKVDYMKVHVGTVIIKDYSKSKLSEKKYTLNKTIEFKDLNENTSIRALVLRAVLGPVGDVAGDVIKNVSGSLKGATDAISNTGKGLFEGIKKVVPKK